jgi:exonuclease SbcC
MVEDARKVSAGARKVQTDKVRALTKKCTELDIVVADDRLRDSVVNELARAKVEAAQIAEAIERADELRSSIEQARTAAQVAGNLGRHLRAEGFERWLLEEAFRRLVFGASRILRDLSNGQYSLEYDDRLNFEVVDHYNADERRLARTLSGGETFLASLALALTLAEQVADIAARGSARLESLFLDEGFGTLDEDTLDVVTNAIVELSARGRVVGLVTHQKALANEIPVQYRVTKSPSTATAEKVVL